MLFSWKNAWWINSLPRAFDSFSFCHHFSWLNETPVCVRSSNTLITFPIVWMLISLIHLNVIELLLLSWLKLHSYTFPSLFCNVCLNVTCQVKAHKIIDYIIVNGSGIKARWSSRDNQHTVWIVQPYGVNVPSGEKMYSECEQRCLVWGCICVCLLKGDSYATMT